MATLAPPLAPLPRTPADVRRQSNRQVIWALTGGASILLLGFPILAFAFSAALLVNLPDYTPRRARWALAVVLALSISLMMASRPIGLGESDDFVGYYNLYLEIYDGNYERFAQFGGGLEIGLTSLYLLWSLLLPKLSANGLMLCTTLTSTLLFLWWAERTFYGKSNPRGVVLMGAALLLFNIYFSTQLVRQFIALIVLLNAFTAHTHWRRLFYLALACSFHLTALPFYLLYLMVRRGVIGIAVVAVAVVLLRIYFAQIVAAFDLMPQIVAEKALYYVDAVAGYTPSDLASFRMILILCVVSAVIILTSAGKLRPPELRWHAIPWLAALVHLALLPIPLAPLRTTLLVHSIVPGIVLYHVVTPHRRLLLLVFLNLLLLNKIGAYGGLEGDAGLTSTLGALLAAFA